MSQTNRFFAVAFIGSILGWAFLGSTSKYPILAIPILVVWAITHFIERKRG